MPRASLSRSHLAKASSPVELLATRFQEYLHLPDPGPLYVLLGALAANMLDGHTVWLMLVGPPSCGKTELLTATLDVPGTKAVGSITGEAAFLSGTKGKERSAEATGGLLRETGSRGCLIWEEFTAVLSLPRERLGEVLAVLRQVYNGHYPRRIGGEGGRVLEWKGRLAVLAGCTPAIDQAYKIGSEMGERFVMYRFEESPGWGAANRSLHNLEPQKMKAELRGLVKAFFERLRLDWTAHGRRDFSDSEADRIITLAEFAAKGRSPIVRDTYTKEIVDIPAAESPTRLSNVFGQLLVGMEAIGVNQTECWQLLGKMAMDAMPMVRRETVKALAAGQTGCGQIAETVRCSTNSINRALEDLRVHGLAERVNGDWSLNEWAVAHLPFAP